MINFYMATVVIWMVIIYATTFITAEAIRNNGWITEKKETTPLKTIITLFCMAAIPIFRLVVVCALIMMSVKTKEEFEKWRNDLNNQ